MCGIAGFLWRTAGGDADRTRARLRAMTGTLHHRGPDSDGEWLDFEAGVALGHRRLAIVDLSPAGRQPMLSPSGRFALTYNGEIYNHTELRAALEAEGRAPAWRGHSDTETLVAGFDGWGVEATLVGAVGMFALAVWDRRDRTLLLARDRLGEKPLYYGWQGAGADAAFLFGSELKALRAHPACEGRIDPGALAQFMRHGHVGEENAIYLGLRKLAPGALIAIDPADPAAPRARRYWSGAAVAARRGDPSVARLGETEAIDALETLLRDAVGRQMMSDVPLGAFLSGGVDSSTIVALMQQISPRPVKTFTIGFHEPRYDEAVHAKAVAAHLGTEHVTLYVGDAELRDIVPRLPEIYCEPFADGSQIPTILVSRLARGAVTVALSGDGGDELFCGYDRYRQGADLMRTIRSVPRPLRAGLAAMIEATPAGLLDCLLDPFRAVPAGKERNGQRLHRLADYLRSANVTELHRKLVSRWRDPVAVTPGAVEPAGLLDALAPPLDGLTDAEHMMALDMLTYLPDDILAKVDRASMSVSLECRAPLLDHRVVEFAWSLPAAMKLRAGVSKWALRQVLYRHVPAALIERPKMGFEVPVGAWLRGPLRGWAEALLAPAALHADGHFDVTLLRARWDEHLSGRATWSLPLWNALMFLAWRQLDAARPVPQPESLTAAG